MKIIYLNEEIIKGEKSIFLAGPTSMDKNVKSWRIDACEKLEELGFNGIVYVPENSMLELEQDCAKQDIWEKEAVTETSVILFWIPKDLADMTSNIEWLHADNVMYGRPNNIDKTRYLDWIYNFEHNEQPYDNIEELLIGAIRKVDTLNKEKVKKIK